jgi:hypothetical protein
VVSSINGIFLDIAGLARLAIFAQEYLDILRYAATRLNISPLRYRVVVSFTLDRSGTLPPGQGLLVLRTCFEVLLITVSD